jgi:hypothetical protein
VAATSIQINYPNFTTCTIAELESWFPDLRRLKPVPDQTGLQPLLEKIGTKLRDTARNTPNLISREAVTDSAQGIADKHREYDYLIVPRVDGTEIYLNEFRVDLKTGEKFQANDLKSTQQTVQKPPVETTASGQTPPASANGSGGQPLSQGFAASWVYFFPRNQVQSTFRYLGEQKLEGRRSVVLAFAQKPQAVASPGLFRYPGQDGSHVLSRRGLVRPVGFSHFAHPHRASFSSNGRFSRTAERRHSVRGDADCQRVHDSVSAQRRERHLGSGRGNGSRTP